MSALLSCLLLQALPPTDREGSPSRRLHAEVNVRYRQQIEEERRIAEYRQREPVDQPLEFASGRGRFSGRFRFESECEAPPPGKEQEGFGLPPGQHQNQRRDEWPPPPPPWDPWDPPPFEFPGRPFMSVNVRNTPTLTTMTLTGRISKLQFNVNLNSSTVSDLRTDPAVTGTGIFSTPPAAGGGGGSVTPPPPSPTPTPTRLTTTASSSTSVQTSAAAYEDEDSDAPFMAGPELAIPLSQDLSRWSPLGWVPAGTSLGFSARALFGTIEVFETRADAELYGLGLGLRVPLLRWGVFQTEAGFFAGPGYLHTDFGDAWGFNGSAGLHFSLALMKGCAVAASLEAEWFEGDGVSAWGPSVNLGLNLGW